jgi:murein DD-endopeptidase MepM/ murein hydrolase activator NlpD
MSSDIVEGRRIARGSPVGEVGDTGRASACHLHFAISPACIAPEWWVRRGAIWPQRYLESWRSGGILRYGFNRLPVALRLSTDGSRIETSHGAVVPTRVAAVAWEAIKAGAVDPEFSWGHYTGLAVRDGVLVVGCHRIPLEEVQAIREALALPA